MHASTVSLLALSSSLLSSSASSPPAPYVGDLSGCGQIPLLPIFDQYHSLTSSGLIRRYTVHLPFGYDSNEQYSLIVGYHGSSSIGLFFEADTGLDLPQFTPKTIVIYPDGVNGSWAGPSYAMATVPQDLQFTWDLLADVRTKYCIDSSRIYATGMSNGGGFVGTLACNDTVGGEFAAFAPASGSFYTDEGPTANDGCTPARSITPMMEFHGGADASVNYNGGQGEGGIEPSIPDWLGWWAQRNGCTSPPVVEDSFGGDVHHSVWTCRGVTGALQHWKVDDMKHQWPSTEPNFSQLAAGSWPTHIEASALIQKFFANFTRPAE